MPVARVLNIEVGEGTRRNKQFFHINDGWHYYQIAQNQCTRYFKCVLYGQGCRGKATFHPEGGFRHIQEHNHQSDMVYPEEMALKNAILRRCQLDYASFKEIIEEECLRFSPDAAARITYARMQTAKNRAIM